MTTDAIISLITSIVILIILVIITTSLVGIKNNTTDIKDEMFMSNMLNMSQFYLDILTEEEKNVIKMFVGAHKTLRVKKTGPAQGALKSLCEKNIIAEATDYYIYSMQGASFYQLTIIGKHVWYALYLMDKGE